MDGLCNYVNKPWLDFTGRNLEQELGKGWLENIHPEDLQQSISAFSFASGNQSEIRFEFRILSALGIYRWVLVHGVPRFNTEGVYLGYIGSGVDITERIEKEKIIETLSLRNKTLLQTASDGIHIIDLQGNIIETNHSFCKMLGYNSEEILKLNVADFDIKWSREELLLLIQNLFKHPPSSRQKTGARMEQSWMWSSIASV